ncbi:hypothetical protein FQA47_016272, partial [Oryzias melastigma]
MELVFVLWQLIQHQHFRVVSKRSMTPPVVAHYIIWQLEWQRTGDERGSRDLYAEAIYCHRATPDRG